VAEWTGVPLGEILRRAGLKKTAVDVMPTCPDTRRIERPIPVTKALQDDTLLVYAGTTAPHLIGEEMAARLETFQTAAALFTFSRFAIPQDKPGSLPEDDYWAVLAFVLASNGFPPGDNGVLGPATAAGVMLKR
jgi:hypothetical protein